MVDGRVLVDTMGDGRRKGRERYEHAEIWVGRNTYAAM